MSYKSINIENPDIVFPVIRIFYLPLDPISPIATSIGLAIMYFNFTVYLFNARAKLRNNLPKWFSAKLEVLIVDGSHVNKQISTFELLTTMVC